MKSANLEAKITLDDLSNVPSFGDSHVSATMGLEGHAAHQSHHQSMPVYPVKQNKVSFNSEKVYSFPIRVNMDSQGNLQPRVLKIVIFIVSPTNKKSQIGSVEINLCQYVSANSDLLPFKMLLDNSKTNAILKGTIQIESSDSFVSPSSLVGLGSPAQQRTLKSLSMSKSSTQQSTKMDYRKKPTTEGSILDSKMLKKSASEARKVNHFNDTHALMVQALDDSLSSDELLNKLFNNTFRFSWKLSNNQYEEYTPSECIRDIVERNGNGWKKNDEGFDMIDIVQTEYWDKINNKHKGTKNNVVTDRKGHHTYEVSNPDHHEDDEDDEWNEFDMLDEDDEAEEEGEGANGSDDDEHIAFTQKYTRSRRVKPLSEIQVREDLRSWHIST